MSGRAVRQYRERVRQLSKLVACDCGGWPHGPDCAFLASVGAMQERGWCPQCGRRMRRGIQWDAHMGCILRYAMCSPCNRRDMWWIRPEDATQAERDSLGLVEEPVTADAVGQRSE